MTKQKTVLAWCDLETTGLDKESGRILEYAIVCTDLELNDILYMSNIIPQNVGIVRTMMDKYVLKMHRENGLLKELEAIEFNAPQYADSIEQAQDEILQMLNAVRGATGGNIADVIFVIAGNTVGFDKGWIEKDMSILFKALHYRQLDVSAYKVGFPELFGTKTSDAHRAMADIRASIEQQRRMRMIVAAGVKALTEQGIILGV